MALQSPLLTHTNTMVRDGYQFHEYRLTKDPKDLPEFLDLFASGEDGRVRFVWVRDDVVLCNCRKDGYIPNHHFQFYINFRCGCPHPEWHMRANDNHMRNIDLGIYAPTPKQAQLALEWVATLSDDHYKVCRFGTSYCEPPENLLGPDIIRNIMETNSTKSPDRTIEFHHLKFTKDESRAFVSKDVAGAKFCFSDCLFQDGGAAFIQALQGNERRVEKIAFEGICPDPRFVKGSAGVDAESWKSILSMPLKHIQIGGRGGLDEAHCQAFMAAKTKHLHLQSCKMADKGSALVNAITSGHHGPSSLQVHTNHCNRHSPLVAGTFATENWYRLLTAPLDKLHLTGMTFEGDDCHAVAYSKASSLHLDKCWFWGFCPLVGSITSGSGPKDLRLALEWDKGFDLACAESGMESPLYGHIVPDLAKAIASPTCRLERYVLEGKGFPLDTALPHLTNAIAQNKSLVHLGLCTAEKNLNDILLCGMYTGDVSLVTGFFDAIASLPPHSRLASLDIQLGYSIHGDVQEARKEVTLSLARMLSRNRRVKAVKFYPETYDKDVWVVRVAPLLRQNIVMGAKYHLERARGE